MQDVYFILFLASSCHLGSATQHLRRGALSDHDVCRADPGFTRISQLLSIKLFMFLYHIAAVSKALRWRTPSLSNSCIFSGRCPRTCTAGRRAPPWAGQAWKRWTSRTTTPHRSQNPSTVAGKVEEECIVGQGTVKWTVDSEVDSGQWTVDSDKG